VRAERESYILLIDIEPNGTVNVIYPCYSDELKKKTEWNRPKIGTVTGSFGTEHVKVFAFEQLPPGLKDFMCEQFPPTDEKLDRLMDMVKKAKNAAQSTIMVQTAALEDLQN
jgi:hypothetical protein